MSRDIVDTSFVVGGQPCRRRSWLSPPSCSKGVAKATWPRDYGLSRYWVHRLVSRYHADGAAAFEPRSRRPHHQGHAVSDEVEDKIVRLRKSLSKQGYDAGAATIAEHLARELTVADMPAVSTIWRILHKRGFVTPQPHKRPRSAWKRGLVSTLRLFVNLVQVDTDNAARSTHAVTSQFAVGNEPTHSPGADLEILSGFGDGDVSRAITSSSI
jgi:Homeodomain-like domain